MTPAELSWEYGGHVAPVVESGEYEGIIRDWKLGRPFGRVGLAFRVELVSGPYTDGISPTPDAGTYTPPDRYREAKGTILVAHFNVRTMVGGFRPGRGSKYVRALAKVFDGRLPHDPNPGCLIDRPVRCLVTTVKTDSSGNRLHHSSWYSTVTTFVGPGLADAALPF